MADFLWYPFNDGTGFAALDDIVPAFGPNPTAYQSPKHGELYRVDGTGATSPAGMWNIADNDRVWIIGHSSSGYKVLGDAVGGTIDQSEVVQRLSDCGLPKSVNADIIIYACFSARGEGCLAQKVAQQLSNLGFACATRVYGFTKMMGTKAKRIPVGGGARELRANMGTIDRPKWVGLQHVEDAIKVHIQI